MKDSFVFYKSFYDAIKKIPEECQLELYNAILSYSLEGIEPSNLSSIAEAMFILIRPNIDSSQKRYEASVSNGKKGGRPKKETQEKPSKNLEETKKEPEQNLNVDDNVDVNDDVNEDDTNILCSEDVEEIQKAIIETLGNTNLTVIQEAISYLDDLPLEVIKEALVRTARKQKKWDYAKGILNNWFEKRI